MSYIDKLELLFEAEDGTDRRDFLKKTGGAVLSTALPGGDILGSMLDSDQAGSDDDGGGHEWNECFPIMGKLLKDCLKELPIIKQISSIPLGTRVSVIKRHIAQNYGPSEFDHDGGDDDVFMVPKNTKYVNKINNPIILALESGLIDEDGILEDNLGDSKFLESAFGLLHGSGGYLFSNPALTPDLDFFVKRVGGSNKFAKLFLREWLNFSTEDPLNVGIRALTDLSKRIPALHDFYSTLSGKSPEEAVELLHDMDIIDDKDIAEQAQDDLNDEERYNRRENKSIAKAAKADREYEKTSVGRWEDEGGALGPLDEAIRRLLNVIY